MQIFSVHFRFFSPLAVVWIMFIWGVISPPSIMGQEKTIYLNTGAVEPYTSPERKGFLDLLAADLFGRIGIKGRINRYVGASARALANSNAGIDDGEAIRIKGIDKKFPNLMVVPETIMPNDFVAYSMEPSIQVADWKGLKPYQVAYLIGWQIFMKNAAGAKGVTPVRAPRQMFELLRLGRIDLALFERWQGLWLLREMGIPSKVQEPPLASIPMFMYLHKKHAALVPGVSLALKAMKRDGSYQKIIDLTLTPLKAK